MSEREPVVGIDLGTTNSVVAAVVEGVPRVLPGRAGQLLTPSVVAISKSGKWLVGPVAKRQAVTNSESTVFAAKRLIGRRWGSREVEDARKFLPYPLVAGPEGNDVRVMLGGRAWSIPEISALVLAELKADAEAFFGRPVSKAVVTVPAWFNDGQRQATRAAGQIAGLELLRIINEPTSAALAYGTAKELTGKVVVFDLGGGTLDLSVLEVRGGVFDVLAVGGDSYLGGEDFDRRLVDWLTFHFATKNGGIDLRQDRMALQRLKDAAEKAKCELSSASSAQIHLPFLASGGPDRPALHLDERLSRAELEELTRDLVERAVAVAERTLRDAGVRAQELSDVLLVGGQSRMPRVQEALRTLFGRELSRGAHPEEVVALGAALQANMLAYPGTGARDALLLDVTPRDLGIVVAGGWFQAIIPRNTTIPTSEKHVFTTSQDGQRSVRISVLQGEGERAADNELLGEFVLSGLPAARRGEVEVEVTFDVSADGILAVQARDLATGALQSISVTATSGLSADELERILAEHRAEELAPREGRELAQARRAALEAGLCELAALAGAAEAALGGSLFGKDAIGKSRATAARARAAISRDDPEAMGAEVPHLERALDLYRSLAAGKSGGEGGA